MRIGIALFSLLLLILCVGSSHAQFGDISVASEWVADSNIGGGGYVRIQVMNNGTSPVFIVAVGDNSDINVTYTAPSVAGQWFSWVIPKGDWQADQTGFRSYPWFTAPDTSMEPHLWENFFLTNFQCVAWQAGEEPFAIQPDMLGPTEFRFLLGEGAKRAVYGPLSYVVMGDGGEVLGSGETSITGVVPTEGASFGQVKALYSR